MNATTTRNGIALTPREREVLAAVAEVGDDVDGIAAKTWIRKSNVRDILKRLRSMGLMKGGGA